MFFLVATASVRRPPPVTEETPMKIARLLCVSVLLPCLYAGCATSQSGASRDTSSEVALPPYNGPKARVILDEFDWAVGGAGYEVSMEEEDEDGEVRRRSWSVQANKVVNGLEASLRSSLMSTNRFIVADRKGIDNLKREQRLKKEGIAKADSGARKGQVNSADLLIRGTVLEWEEDAGGSGGVGGGLFGGVLGGVGISSQKGKVVVLIEIVDLETMDTLASGQVRGEASSTGLVFGGFGWTGAAILGGAFSEYETKPMGDAIRKAIAESVRLVAGNVPDDYYRHGGREPKPASVAAR